MVRLGASGPCGSCCIFLGYIATGLASSATRNSRWVFIHTMPKSTGHEDDFEAVALLRWINERWEFVWISTNKARQLQPSKVWPARVYLQRSPILATVCYRIVYTIHPQTKSWQQLVSLDCCTQALVVPIRHDSFKRSTTGASMTKHTYVFILI